MRISEIILKGLGKFPQIVPQTEFFAKLGATESRGESGGSFRHFIQMVGKFFPRGFVTRLIGMGMAVKHRIDYSEYTLLRSVNKRLRTIAEMVTVNCSGRAGTAKLPNSI